MIKIYVIVDNRPELIQRQYDNFKKMITDEFELIVIDNCCLPDSERKQEIKSVCDKNNITIIETAIYNGIYEPVNKTELDEGINVVVGEYYIKENDVYINDMLVYYGNYKSFNGASNACSYALDFLFNHLISSNETEPFCVIDSDMFFIKTTNLSSLINDKSFVYVPNYFGIIGCSNCHEYAWNGFIILDPSKIQLSNFGWSTNNLEYNAIGDTGCKTTKIIEKLEDEQKVHVYRLGVNEIGNETTRTEANSYRFTTLNTTDITFNKPYNLPYFEFEELRLPFEQSGIDYKAKAETEIETVKSWIDENELEFPDPCHFDLLRLVDSDEWFIFHYRAGSNYNSFSTDEYNEKKLIALDKIIDSL